MLHFPNPAGAADTEQRRRVESWARDLLTLHEMGDARTFASRLASDFVYQARGAWPMWPFYRGPISRGEFVDALRRFDVEFDAVGADVHEFLVDGDCAVTHISRATRHRGSGPSVPFDQWVFTRFREGLVVEAAVYVDAAKAARLQPGGLVEVRPFGGVLRQGGPELAPPPPQSAVQICADGTVEIGESAFTDDPTGTRLPAARVVLDFFASRAKGDLDGMLSRLAPDFACNPQGLWTKPLPSAGACDRAAFAEQLRLEIIAFEDLGGPVHEILVDRDRVAIHRTVAGRNRGAGRTGRVDEWVVCRIHDGLIVEMASYIDSARTAGVDRLGYGSRT